MIDKTVLICYSIGMIIGSFILMLLNGQDNIYCELAIALLFLAFSIKKEKP